MNFSELTNEQAREAIDCEQAFGAWRDADRELRERYAGPMYWRPSGAGDHFYREIREIKHSLGVRSPDTEAAGAAFTQGRAAINATLKRTTRRMNAMAPVNKALRLNRIPRTAARILRRLDSAGLLGKPIQVAGTHALYALERACGVHVSSVLATTNDMDLLWDSRAGLKPAATPELRISGVMGRLQKLDRTFRLMGKNSYRAVNSAGYMVDLIALNIGKDPTISPPQRMGASANELTAVEIGGLAWLANSPSFECVAIGEDGFPLRMVTPDLRAWGLHKLRQSEREDREPVKRGRDRAQGALAIDLLTSRRPDLPFDAATLQALPKSVRALAARRDEQIVEQNTESDALQPDW